MRKPRSCRVAVIGPSQGAPTEFSRQRSETRGDRYFAGSQNRRNHGKETGRLKAVRYHWIDNLPVGQHHDQKLLCRTRCHRLLARPPVMEKLSLATPEPAKIPHEERIIEIATAIAPMNANKRIKTILYKLVRLTVPIGCMIEASSNSTRLVDHAP
jgi:hypothetical protein